MRTSLISLLAVAGLSACGPGADAVWLFSFDQGSETVNEGTCTTNFITSTCPEGSDPGDPGPWTSTTDESVSNGAFFGQILDSANGEKVLVVDGDIYVGTKSGGEWIFEWEHFEDGKTELVHEAGYRFISEQNRTFTQTIVVDLSGDTAVGTISNELDSTETVIESDSWLADDVGFSYGRIFDEAPVYLDGDRVNFNQDSDCDGSDCRIEGTSKRVWSAKVTAARTDAGRDGYEGISDASRPLGYDE